MWEIGILLENKMNKCDLLVNKTFSVVICKEPSICHALSIYPSEGILPGEQFHIQCVDGDSYRATCGLTGLLTSRQTCEEPMKFLKFPGTP